jgi:hypothetical protein
LKLQLIAIKDNYPYKGKTKRGFSFGDTFQKIEKLYGKPENDVERTATITRKVLLLLFYLQVVTLIKKNQTRYASFRLAPVLIF